MPFLLSSHTYVCNNKCKIKIIIILIIINVKIILLTEKSEEILKRYQTLKKVFN